MKGRAWERLVRRDLLPELPEGFDAQGSLVFRRPIEHVLVGISADTSGFAKERIYLEAFVMPLFTPREHLTYFVSQRLGGGTHFEEVSEDVLPDSTKRLILQEGLKFLKPLDTLDRFLADSTWKDHGRIGHLEVEGYGYLLSGDVNGAIATLTHALSLAPRFVTDSETKSRCESVVAQLQTETVIQPSFNSRRGSAKR